MATTMKGLLKGLRYITQIFEDEEKEEEMQIGFPTDVKHVAHIGNDGPATNAPSWMNDFKPQENGQVVSRGNSNKYNSQEMNQSGGGLKELLPPNTNEKQKQKTRRSKPGHNGSASSDGSVKQSRHNRSKHGSMDSSLSDQEPSVRSRRRGGGGSSKDAEGSSNHIPPDGSAPPRKATSKPRKLKGSIGGEGSVKKSSKGKPESSVDDTCNDFI
ncbi:CRIB domain-containing protein RIC1 [Raphanus sativus]|uniref:CRIB domain-containing protein RIC1 n=1 Tax=Raphanus sativus TaxID=3726 RepID=A0A6J0JS83_RAPSA|nr:CRIB domain-containing protein RIC1 [Raphanus sativus]KAJ4891553.1 CRIB domain-containing protein RIC1 [Raphanus sativus]